MVPERPTNRYKANDESRQALMESGRSGELSSVEGLEEGEHLAGDVALETSDDLRLGLAFEGAAFDVGPGAELEAHAAHDDAPQCLIGLAVSCPVQPPSDDLARRRRDG